jgi:hypothetical protein
MLSKEDNRLCRVEEGLFQTTPRTSLKIKPYSGSGTKPNTKVAGNMISYYLSRLKAAPCRTRHLCAEAFCSGLTLRAVTLFEGHTYSLQSFL